MAVSLEQPQWKEESSRVKTGCEGGMSSSRRFNARRIVTGRNEVNWEQAASSVSSMLPNGYKKILVCLVKIDSANVIAKGNSHVWPQTSGVGTHQEPDKLPRNN